MKPSPESPNGHHDPAVGDACRSRSGRRASRSTSRPGRRGTSGSRSVKLRATRAEIAADTLASGTRSRSSSCPLAQRLVDAELVAAAGRRHAVHARLGAERAVVEARQVVGGAARDRRGRPARAPGGARRRCRARRAARPRPGPAPAPRRRPRTCGRPPRAATTPSPLDVDLAHHRADHQSPRAIAKQRGLGVERGPRQHRAGGLLPDADPTVRAQPREEAIATSRGVDDGVRDALGVERLATRGAVTVVAPQQAATQDRGDAAGALEPLPGLDERSASRMRSRRRGGVSRHSRVGPERRRRAGAAGPCRSSEHDVVPATRELGRGRQTPRTGSDHDASHVGHVTREDGPMVDLPFPAAQRAVRARRRRAPGAPSGRVRRGRRPAGGLAAAVRRPPPGLGLRHRDADADGAALGRVDRRAADVDPRRARGHRRPPARRVRRHRPGRGRARHRRGQRPAGASGRHPPGPRVAAARRRGRAPARARLHARWSPGPAPPTPRGGRSSSRPASPTTAYAARLDMGAGTDGVDRCGSVPGWTDRGRTTWPRPRLTA